MDILGNVDPFDLMAVVITGILMVGWVPVCFPIVVRTWSGAGLPEAFVIASLTALVIFVGQIIVAVSSFLEPALYVTWGGRQSTAALSGRRTKLIDHSSAQHLVGSLRKQVGDSASMQSLFLCARQLADGEPNSLTPRFNALYAYERSQLVFLSAALLCFVVSAKWGAASGWPRALAWVVLASLVSCLVWSWRRARQRSEYFVREVLTTAKRVLDRHA